MASNLLYFLVFCYVGVSQISCANWCEYKNKYLSGYSFGEYVFTDLSAAQMECENHQFGDCGGITQESANRFTLRKGKELKDSPSGETSWQICDKPSDNHGTLVAGCKHPLTFLRGYLLQDKGFNSLEAAQYLCGEITDCYGITKSWYTGK